MTQDQGVPLRVGLSPTAEPLRVSSPDGASIPNALYTHNHAGWRRHELPGADEESLHAALHATHGFLAEYTGQFRVEIKRTPEYSFDGKVVVYWDSDKPKTFVFGPSLWRGDHWFTAFEFNEAPVGACRYCGGTGVDHYSPFSHCWACDGTATQIRKSTPRGFMKKPVAACPPSMHARYAEWLSAQAIEARSGETERLDPKGESAVHEVDASEHARQLSKQGHTKRRKKVHDMVDKMRADMGKAPIDWGNLA